MSSRIDKIKARIEDWKKNKAKLIDFANRWQFKLHSGDISELEYNTIVDSTLRNKSLGEWIRIHNENIRHGYHLLDSIARKEKKDRTLYTLRFIGLLVMIGLFIFGIIEVQPAITGMVLSEQQKGQGFLLIFTFIGSALIFYFIMRAE